MTEAEACSVLGIEAEEGQQVTACHVLSAALAFPCGVAHERR